MTDLADRPTINMEAPVTQRDNVLTMKNLSYTYPSGTLAVRDVNLEVKESSVLGIVGPSGCGKSTLLQVIAGLRSESSGELWRAPLEPGRHPLTMVFQQDTVLPWMTVEKNVEIHWQFRGTKMPKAEREKHIDHLLELAGLAHVRKKYPYELSGGMRRRVAFLTAVMPYPGMLLLDEPFSSLDVPTRVGIHQSTHDMIREMGIATVLVTHDLEEAICLSDEIIILTSGPGTVAKRHKVPFGAERNILELRGQQDFLELYGKLWRDLSEQIVASRKGGRE